MSTTIKNKATISHILESHNSELVQVRTACTFLRATCHKYGHVKEVRQIAILETKLLARITHLREVKIAETRHGSS